MVAWRRLAEVPDGDESLLWLYGVARNVVRNHRRFRAIEALSCTARCP